MDLVERLVESVNETVDLPYKVIAGYMRPGECIALAPDPGSSTLDEDWSGNAYELHDCNANKRRRTG